MLRDRRAHTTPHGDPLADLPSVEFPPAPPQRCAMCGNESKMWVPVADVFEGLYPAVCERCAGVLADRQHNVNTRTVISIWHPALTVGALLNGSTALKVYDPWEDRRR